MDFQSLFAQFLSGDAGSQASTYRSLALFLPELILSGSLAPLIPARAGDRFEMEIDGLGSCSIAFS